uniref:Protein kinase domain-containing protein n=1 Tax=Quercus lobata TaxID=97700 RepID=A0A7N2R2L2_QUELO
MGSRLTHTQSRNLFPPWATGKNVSSKVKGHSPGFDSIVTKPTETKSGDHREITHVMVLKPHKAHRLLGVTLVLLVLLLCSFIKKRKDTASSDSENFLLNLSYQNLLNATDGFSSTNLIGVGGFGSVYKGILNQGRHIAAVKVLNLLRHGASKSFIAECEALRNIRHRNLVKVLTSCSGIDYQGQDFKALVYKFIANGNLDEWLHPTSRIDEGHEEPRNLSLLQRVNISIDFANALNYLHHHCQMPIVHCNLKPSNVLLDDKMIGHVGDFGLARFIFDATQDCSIDQPSSIGIRGTIGYTPPEYGMGNEVSTYGDVYSYALPEQIIHIIDPILLRERGDEETVMNETHSESRIGSTKIQECLILILEIGVACSMEFHRERMSISSLNADTFCFVEPWACGPPLSVEEAVYHALWECPLATNVWAMVKGKLQKCAAILQNFHLLARQMKGKLTGKKMEIWVIVA